MNLNIEFWHWFITNIKSVKQLCSDDTLVAQLDQHVRNLGNFSWEVGPGLRKKYAFVLSPSGDKERLVKTKKIICTAPEHEEWEWHYAKPPKDFDFRIEIPQGSSNILIDGSRWQVGMLKYSDGRIELDVKADSLNDFAGEYQRNAVDIMIISVIGEENYIEYIESINVVDKFEDRLTNATFSIAQLKNRFEYEINNQFN